MERLKPWMAAVTVLAVAVKKAGEDPAMGIDMHFLTEAAPLHRIDQLEIPYSQLSIFAFAPEKEQLELLETWLKQSERAAELTEMTQTAYLHADLDELIRLFHEQEPGPASLSKKIIEERNSRMARRLEQYLRGNERCFVVIGAAHIVGAKGVAQILQSRGYQVERLTVAMH